MIAEVSLEIAGAIGRLDQVRCVDLDEGPKKTAQRETVSFVVELRDGSRKRVTVHVKTERPARVMGFASTE